MDKIIRTTIEARAPLAQWSTLDTTLVTDALDMSVTLFRWIAGATVKSCRTASSEPCAITQIMFSNLHD